jgi:hypothetical protein
LFNLEIDRPYHYLQDIASLGFERLEVYIKRGVGFQQKRRLVTKIRFMPVGRSFRPRIAWRARSL